MVSALYAVLGALLLIKFSFDVVRLRMQYRVAYGDGGFSELQSAIRIHGNAVEYIPVALVLLLFMEMNGAETWMVHICGLILIAGLLIVFRLLLTVVFFFILIILRRRLLLLLFLLL